MVRHNVTFRTSLTIDFEAHPVGEELAIELSNLLKRHGLDLSLIDNHDDFAWSMDSPVRRTSPWLLLGYVGDADVEFLLQIKSRIGLIGRLLGRSDSAARDDIARRLHAILSEDTRFSAIRWHVGDFAVGTPSETPEGKRSTP